MFDDYSSPVLGFQSVSGVRNKKVDEISQTTTTETSEVGLLSKDFCSQAEQTTSEKFEEAATLNENGLNDFLRNAASLVEQELEISRNLPYFDNLDYKDDSSEITRLHEFPPPTTVSNKQVKCLAWNVRESTLSVGFSVVRHDSFCNHQSAVGIYTIKKPSFPQILTTSSCVTSLKFHNSDPWILLTGLFSGKVIVWDQSKDGQAVAEEPSAEHTGHIVQVDWLDKSTFFSAGSDGCILVRVLSRDQWTFSTIRRFIIMGGMEISAMCRISEANFITGVTGGRLYNCQLSVLQPENNKTGYQDPIIHEYQSHLTIITAIKSSGEVFAAASADGLIAIYKNPQVEALWTIRMNDCINDLVWTQKPTILGICTGEEQVFFAKITTGEILPTILKLNAHNIATTLLRSSSSMIAVGTLAGTTEIWLAAI